MNQRTMKTKNITMKKMIKKLISAGNGYENNDSQNMVLPEFLRNRVSRETIDHIIEFHTQVRIAKQNSLKSIIVSEF